MSHGNTVIIIILLLVIIFAIFLIFIQADSVENAYSLCLSNGVNGIEKEDDGRSFSYRPSINYEKHCAFIHNNDINSNTIWPYAILLAGIVSVASYPLLEHKNIAVNLIAIFLIVVLFSYIFMYFLLKLVLEDTISQYKHKNKKTGSDKKVHWKDTNDSDDDDVYNIHCNGITYVDMDM